MTADRLISLIGLGFGDCGKGLCVDALVRRHGAHTVVRFNGGAQAGHNVVLPDGRHHTCSQIGAGIFSAGVATVLASPVVVHPTALLEEAAALARAGVDDALARLHVDPRCRVTTPYHQAAGRLREWLRGAAAHGSCGAGFGETVCHALEHADEVLCWGDLSDDGADVEALLDATRRTLCAQLVDALAGADPAPLHGHAEWRVLGNDAVAERWLERAHHAAQQCAAGGRDAMLERLARPGTLIFEGAQGTLLDERHGFHPHTSWSRIDTGAVDAVVGEAGRPAEVTHLGVVRSYLTRHGAGPLPTEDRALDAALAEPHNGDHGPQGRFRRGHGDALLLRYAVDAAGRLDGIVVTHLDALRHGGIRWCSAYRVPREAIEASACVVAADDSERVVGLRAVAVASSLAVGARVGAMLERTDPIYEGAPLCRAEVLLERIEATAGLPVLHVASGPTHVHFGPRGGAGAHNAVPPPCLASPRTVPTPP